MFHYTHCSATITTCQNFWDDPRTTVFVFYSQVMGKAGEVGDRTVWVRSAGIDGRPVLEIIKRKKYMEAKDNLEWMATDPPIIRIFYTKIKPTEK